MTTDATVTTVTSFHVYPGRLDYELVAGQGSISFRQEQRIVVRTESDGTFTIRFERD